MASCLETYRGFAYKKRRQSKMDDALGTTFSNSREDTTNFLFLNYSSVHRNVANVIQKSLRKSFAHLISSLHFQGERKKLVREAYSLNAFAKKKHKFFLFKPSLFRCLRQIGLLDSVSFLER